MRELAVQFLALANKQTATGPLMMAHRLMGLSLLHTGEIADGRAHLDRAITLYDPAEHRPLATRFGQDIGAATLSWKSLAFWLLGYPQAALTDSEHALKVAREIGHSATLMYVLNFSAWTHILCGNYAAANALVDAFSGLKDQTGSLFWGAWGMTQRGCLLALTGKVSDAVQTITCGLSAMRHCKVGRRRPQRSLSLAEPASPLMAFSDHVAVLVERASAGTELRNNALGPFSGCMRTSGWITGGGRLRRLSSLILPSERGLWVVEQRGLEISLRLIFGQAE